jgi:hypothetical protein
VHARLQKALRAGDAAAAHQALTACRSLAWPEVAPLYEALGSRMPQPA